MKKIISSKYFYLVIVSIVALILSIIEYITILFATPYSYLPMMISIGILLGLFIYAFTFKKNQSKINLSIILLILIWSASLFYFSLLHGIKVGDTYLTSPKDRISIVEFKFPGILQSIQYEYNNISEAVGTRVRCEYTVIYFNLMVSIVMLIGSGIILLSRYKKESEVEEEIEIDLSPTIVSSPYFFMVFVSTLAFILSFIECILLSFSMNSATIMMVVDSVIFLILFIYSLFSKKSKYLYNYTSMVFVIFWTYNALQLFGLSMTQTNSGRDYYSLGFIFPCMITKSHYTYPSHALVSTWIEYIYLNWLFSFLMIIVSFLILYRKEKHLFKEILEKKGKKNKNEIY